LSCLVLGAEGAAQNLPPWVPSVNGDWDPPFNHDASPSRLMNTCGTAAWPATFNAVHMSLIPDGDRRGCVLVWDEGPEGATCQRWAIVDPETQQVWNYFMALPGGSNQPSNPPSDADGDLFCSAHAWTKDGKLFVAGGTVYDPNSTYFDGALLTLIWDPVNWNNLAIGNRGFGWHWLSSSPLEKQRYYPTVTVLADDTFMVSGGLDTSANYLQGGAAVTNTYEVFRLTTATTGSYERLGGNGTQAYAGPQVPASGGYYNLYPRMHLLADATGGAVGWAVYTGFARDNGRVLHDEFAGPTWDHAVANFATTAGQEYLHYNSSVLRPIDLNVPNTEDRLMRLGGAAGPYAFGNYAARTTVETCALQSSDPSWKTSANPMKSKRCQSSAVLLPDSSLLMVGGTTKLVPSAQADWVMNGEFLYDAAWTDTPPMGSKRDYHHAAVLLANGKVFVGGGDGRDFDYQIYNPRYLYRSPRPQMVPMQSNILNYGIQYFVDWSMSGSGSDSVVQRIVLMRPGSITHHSDFEQRFVALELVAVTGSPVTRTHFMAPPDSRHAPKGWYMLFAVSDNNVPSEAQWVKLQ